MSNHRHHLPVVTVQRHDGKVKVCPHCHKEVTPASIYTDAKGWKFHRPCFYRGKGSIKTSAFDPRSFLSKLAGQVPVPHERQVDDAACGPAVLKSVEEAMGAGGESQQQLEQETGTTEDNGTPIVNLEQAATNHGMNVDSRNKMDLQQLQQAVASGHPVITAVQLDGPEGGPSQGWDSGHYVVVTGISNGQITFMDPNADVPERTWPIQEFLNRWHDHDHQGHAFEQWGMTLTPKQAEEKTAVSSDLVAKTLSNAIDRGVPDTRIDQYLSRVKSWVPGARDRALQKLDTIDAQYPLPAAHTPTVATNLFKQLGGQPANYPDGLQPHVGGGMAYPSGNVHYPAATPTALHELGHMATHNHPDPVTHAPPREVPLTSNRNILLQEWATNRRMLNPEMHKALQSSGSGAAIPPVAKLREWTKAEMEGYRLPMLNDLANQWKQGLNKYIPDFHSGKLRGLARRLVGRAKQAADGALGSGADQSQNSQQAQVMDGSGMTPAGHSDQQPASEQAPNEQLLSMCDQQPDPTIFDTMSMGMGNNQQPLANTGVAYPGHHATVPWKNRIAEMVNTSYQDSGASGAGGKTQAPSSAAGHGDIGGSSGTSVQQQPGMSAAETTEPSMQLDSDTASTGQLPHLNA